MIVERPDSLPSLVPLICGSDGCYLYGDPHLRLIETKPIYPLLISTHVPDNMTLSLLTSVCMVARPRNANAIYLGLPARRYKDPALCDLPIQFWNL
jgi:hypothetical protein